MASGGKICGMLPNEFWASSAYSELAERGEFLSLEEAKRLDTATIVEIAKARERWFMVTPNAVHKRRRS